LVISPNGRRISGGIINILVDGDISICTQPSDVSFTESLEIPFQLIAKAKLEDTILQGAASYATSAIDLVVELKANSDVCCYMNALPVNIDGIRFTVNDEDLADEMGQDFLRGKSTQKASQSQETIAIADSFHDALCPEDDEFSRDSNEERTKCCLDPAVLRPREDTQDDEQETELNNFIEESPQENHIRQANSQFNQGIEENFAVDTGLTAEHIYEDNQYEADDREPLQSEAPTSLSHLESDTRASADKADNENPDFNADHRSLRWTLRRKAPLLTSIPKPTVPKPSSDEDFDEMAGPSAGPVVPHVEPAQPKTKSERLKAKPIPKAKQKVTKPGSPSEEIQKVKKYSLKPGREVSIVRAVASEQVSAPKASLPKGGLKASAPKPDLMLKPVSSLVAKAPKKTTSKLLVPKKPVVEKIPKRPVRQMQANSPELKSPEKQNSRASSEGHIEPSLGQDNNEVLMQEDMAINRRATMLSAALADIDDIDQGDTNFGEPIQTSLLYQRSQATVHTESSLSAVAVQGTTVQAQEEAYSPCMLIPEVMDVIPKNNKNQSPQVVVQSESSPSSLERVSPVPLPAREAIPAECFSQEATTMPSRVLAGPTGPRRSPRLALRYSSRDVSVALSSFQAKDPRPAARSIVIDQNDNNEPQHKGATWNDDTPLRANESPLFGDHLARKTPLISFSAIGPRNQGISNLKKSSLQRIKRRRQIEKPEDRPPPTQIYTRKQPSKRKRDKEDDPMVEKNKRQQTSLLQKSKEGSFIAIKESPVVFPDSENHIVPGRHRVVRNTARFGSQGSRVNENGSPRGNSNSLKEQTDYRAIVRKVLTDNNPTIMNGDDNGDSSFHYDDDEGLDIVDSGQLFDFDLAAVSPTSFKVGSPSPRLYEEVVKRYLPRSKATYSQYRKIERKVVRHQQDKLADPFLKKSPEKDLSSFARRLQYRRQTPIQKPRTNPASRIPRKIRYTMDEDPEVTLVNVENENPMREDSSSSNMTSESSDEDQDHGAHKTATEALEVQCKEWRMALKPHQRGILDILNQVSAVSNPRFIIIEHTNLLLGSCAASYKS
jgi:hypothetical protein